VGCIGHGQNSLLNLRGETKHTHDLRHPGSGDALLAGDIDLTGDLSGFQESLPLDGLTEEFNYSGNLRFPWRFGVATAGRNSANQLTWRRSQPQGADVAVFKGPFGPEGDLDHLFEVGCHRGAIAANLGGMNDPESDLGVRLAISRPAHLGARIGL
jgi:hypothetical protein